MPTPAERRMLAILADQGARPRGLGIVEGEWDWLEKGLGLPGRLDPQVEQPQFEIGQPEGRLEAFRRRMGESILPWETAQAMGMEGSQYLRNRDNLRKQLGLGMLMSIGTGDDPHGLVDLGLGALTDAYRIRAGQEEQRYRRGRDVTEDERAEQTQRLNERYRRDELDFRREDALRGDETALEVARIGASSRENVANIRGSRPPKPWNIKAADANAITRNAAQLFGGFWDPITGQFAGLAPDVAQKALGIAEEAERIFVEGAGKVGHNDAVAEAARRYGITIPGASPAADGQSGVRRWNPTTRKFE